MGCSVASDSGVYRFQKPTGTCFNLVKASGRNVVGVEEGTHKAHGKRTGVPILIDLIAVHAAGGDDSKVR